MGKLRKCSYRKEDFPNTVRQIFRVGWCMKGKHLPLIFTFPPTSVRSHIAQHAYTAASIRALSPLDLSACDVLQFIPSPIESEMNARGFVGYRIEEILQNDRVTMTNR